MQIFVSKRRRFLISAVMSVLVFAGLPIKAQESVPFDHATLADRLHAKPTGDAAVKLAEEVRKWFGSKDLKKGARPKVEGINVAVAIEVEKPVAAPVVVDTFRDLTLPLTRIGETNLYVASVGLKPSSAWNWAYRIGDEQLSSGTLEVYLEHHENLPDASKPKGVLKEMGVFRSKVFGNTSRKWWVYVPAQYDPKEAACVMVFQDGQSYKDFVPTVFDNLIASKEMPVTIGIFIEPGKLESGKSNRSFEYDTLSDQYARFLMEEILPETEKQWKLRHDAAGRAIAGISSGGICAFTVAWERPDQFSKVLSWVGSFTNIAHGKTMREGGHNYPALIRKTPIKPIRVFLQDGSNDLDNANGNWPLANQQMAKALRYSGYDYQFVMGEGFHSNLHGRAILPDSLKWLWRETPAEAKK
jgi:enterochelin esterase family protein